MNIEQANDAIRRAIWPGRAVQWHDAMTPAQYVERNNRLFSHPYSTKIDTWVGRDSSGKILTSLDLLRIELATSKSQLPSFVVASVYTPPEHRRKNYASSLVNSILSSSNRPAVLYSDLRPSYYEKLGFVDAPVSQIEERVHLASKPVSGEPVDSARFLAALNKRKSEILEAGQTTLQITRLYNAEDLDWNIERYRFFSQLQNTRLPEELYWLGVHNSQSHPLLLVPDYLASRVDALVLNSSCKECIGFLMNQAKYYGLPRVRYWKPNPLGEKHPMVRFPENPTIKWIDHQLLDYW